MAWMETDYSKHLHFLWKIQWRLEHLGALGIMGEVAPLGSFFSGTFLENQEKFIKYLKKIGQASFFQLVY